MSKHTLFLLTPGFFDGEEGPFFCPHSAALEGLLKYVPEIEIHVEIKRIGFTRPRQEITALLGEENQFTPVLILNENAEDKEDAEISAQTGRAFLLGEIAISKYLHKTLGIMKPH